MYGIILNGIKLYVYASMAFSKQVKWFHCVGRRVNTALLMFMRDCFSFVAKEIVMEKTLLSFNEFCNYTGIGKTKARELTKSPDCKFVVRIGRRVFIHKELFDAELKKNAKFQLVM